MDPEGSHSLGRRVETWVALVLCIATAAARPLERLVSGRPTCAGAFAPSWIPLVAAGLVAAGLVRWSPFPAWNRGRRALSWSGLLLMVWAANGLPFDVLRVAGLIPLPVDWPGMATRTLALAATVVLAHLLLTAPASTRAASWYGYAAFVLALPYPVLRTFWALGATPGLSRPGAAGVGWAPWVIGIPWLLAAVLSLLLVPTWRWMPRRLLLTAGWSATTIVAMIGPAACWVLFNAMAGIGTPRPHPSGIAAWVFALLYGSWFLWAIAAGAATRSYQVRTAPLEVSSTT